MSIEYILQENEVHLWVCDTLQVRDSETLSHYRQLLSDEESHRVDRFYFDKDRYDYLVSHAMMRLILSKYAPIAPQDWTFEKNTHGKPYISERHSLDTDLQFNLSHTEGKTVFAITTLNSLGIDIEAKNRTSHYLNLANHFFSSTEAKDLQTANEKVQKERFFDYWTLKEAFIKAVGKGLSIPLDSFSFELLTSQRIKLSMQDKAEFPPNHWQFWSLDYRETYTIALCKACSPGESLPVLQVIDFLNLESLELNLRYCS